MDENNGPACMGMNISESVLRGKYRLLVRSAMVNKYSIGKKRKRSTLTENSYKEAIFS